jgi:hypothetical protein
MPQLLIRDIPDELSEWIDEQSHLQRTSKKKFVLSLLEGAWKEEDELPLFANVDVPPATIVRGGLPFTFIDLFAGIGGLRLGLERVGGRCIFSSEWDKYAQKTYSTWFGEMPHGDIRKINPADIPVESPGEGGDVAVGFPTRSPHRQEWQGRDNPAITPAHDSARDSETSAPNRRFRRPPGASRLSMVSRPRDRPQPRPLTYPATCLGSGANAMNSTEKSPGGVPMKRMI